MEPGTGPPRKREREREREKVINGLQTYCQAKHPMKYKYTVYIYMFSLFHWISKFVGTVPTSSFCSH